MANLFIQKTGLYILDTIATNSLIGTMAFDSGSVEPEVDEILIDAISGATAKVNSVTLATGTWVGGDATGTISLKECSGRFNDNSNINGSIGGDNILTVNEPDSGAGVDLVRNGEFEGGTDGWTAGAGATLASVAGGKVGNCLRITCDTTANRYASQQITTVIGKTHVVLIHFKKGTAATGKIRIGTAINGAQYYDSGNISDADWAAYLVTLKATTTTTFITLISGEASKTALLDEISLYELNPEVVADGKTVIVDSVVFVPSANDGDDLILTDIDGNIFVETKGLKNKPNPISFSNPMMLNGLKVATIDSGKAYVYLAR